MRHAKMYAPALTVVDVALDVLCDHCNFNVPAVVLLIITPFIEKAASNDASVPNAPDVSEPSKVDRPQPPPSPEVEFPAVPIRR